MVHAPRVRASSTILDAVSSAVLRHGSGLTALETLALLGLARLADDAAGAPVVRTHGDLAGRWACSVATVKRVLAALALRGLIRIERRKGPGGGDAPSCYALNLDALGVVPREPEPPSDGTPPAHGEQGALVTRASDPDLRSGIGDPERSVRAAEPSPVESIPEIRDAARELHAAMAAEPCLAALAVPAIVGPLARAVVRARKPVRVAARGLAELAAAVAIAAGGGAPWSPREVLRGLTSWALNAREDGPTEAGDYRARVAPIVAASRVDGRIVEAGAVPMPRGLPAWGRVG